MANEQLRQFIRAKEVASQDFRKAGKALDGRTPRGAEQERWADEAFDAGALWALSWLAWQEQREACFAQWADRCAAFQSEYQDLGSQPTERILRELVNRHLNQQERDG
jgi:hypothetical protein